MSTPLTLHEEFKENRAQNKASFADSKDNIDNSQSILIDYIHNEFLESQRKNEKSIDELKSENSREHQYILESKKTEHEKIFDKLDLYVRGQVETEKRMKECYADAIDSFDVKFKDISDEVINLKLKDASFYGKMFIISFLVGTGITLFLTKFWGEIVDFLFKKV